MNIDFHVHGILSKKLKFDSELFLQGVEYAKENGLDGFVLCEHFNAIDLLSSYSYLEENYEYVGDRYIVDGFSVFIGMEVDIRYGGHVIVCGNREDILKIRNYLEPYTSKSNFIPFGKLLDLGEKYNCLMIGSHPYREKHKLYLQPKKYLERLDALDLNTKDIYKRGLSIVEEEVATLAENLNIPYVTGSDSHYPVQLGTVKTCFENECYTINDLKENIKSKKYVIEISKALKLKVYTSKITKNYIKKQIKLSKNNYKNLKSN
ncbi:PHP-associated domain-containing protein [Clostridium taeniosporum]|uniref:Histidinol-phosphatase n=1 Tax=Clostridium taeniosporum TaxID=394958 RepID=A0A1D7XKA1_9CLOT|nr:PHP domain-containing protein [Clostridium taeniosporum]AOR23600.1 histidinol-phosphatase [Clostridium taeniosporum]